MEGFVLKKSFSSHCIQNKNIDHQKEPQVITLAIGSLNRKRGHRFQLSFEYQEKNSRGSAN